MGFQQLCRIPIWGLWVRRLPGELPTCGHDSSPLGGAAELAEPCPVTRCYDPVEKDLLSEPDEIRRESAAMALSATSVSAKTECITSVRLPSTFGFTGGAGAASGVVWGPQDGE